MKSVNANFGTNINLRTVISLNIWLGLFLLIGAFGFPFVEEIPKTFQNTVLVISGALSLWAGTTRKSSVAYRINVVLGLTYIVGCPFLMLLKTTNNFWYVPDLMRLEDGNLFVGVMLGFIFLLTGAVLKRKNNARHREDQTIEDFEP